MSDQERLNFFKTMISQNRAWWFQDNNYLPRIYSELTDEEYGIMHDWYLNTHARKLIGECGIPAISTMLGFIDGNNIQRIVQLGTYAGYSTLLFGFALRRMGRGKLVTFDVLEEADHYTRTWVSIAGLEKYVDCYLSNSTDPASVQKAREAFSHEKPQMLFIDSSHQYEQTKKELSLWAPEMAEGGLIFLHDTSTQAIEYDKTNQGGVRKALAEYLTYQEENGINIDGAVYKDGCGLGIIQVNNG